MVKASQLSRLIGMHDMVLGLSQQEAIQNFGGGCSRLQGPGCGEATRSDTEGGEGFAQGQWQGDDHVRVTQAWLVQE